MDEEILKIHGSWRVRPYYSPKKSIPKSVFEKRTAKQKWYYEQSLLRYCKDPLQKRLLNTVSKAMVRGEIGRFESFRFVTSEEVSHVPKKA
jgi:hypothetical protein